MRLFDVEKQFAFYGAYHSNPVNFLIHMVFVGPIFFTALILFYFTPPLLNSTPIQLYEDSCFLGLNLGFLFTLIYALFYVYLDKKAGSLAALLCLLYWVSSSFVAHYLGFSLAWKVVLVAQLFCWTGLVIGHGVFEALWTFTGYEPYPGFHAKVKATIDAEIKQWQEKKHKKIS
ncbi:2-hydroxy-palmitic acid dioxygenase mpo1 isoform X2 [Nicotiana tabacum]|uniref:2-hydroxy-palmitic acid dioxygenase mpo1 isoform X2 n=2 Tax=Nicotiana TaxID=4085 RepID=A0AC58TFP7_TOBAC|nr:PREDICTED: uncharacterized endoplasmic reticulum membrane protein C16E8.02-like isoform X2 [Nicotiana sylvestris]